MATSVHEWPRQLTPTHRGPESLPVMEGRCLMDPPFEQIIEEILSEKVVKKVWRRDCFLWFFEHFVQNPREGIVWAKPSRESALQISSRICPEIDFFSRVLLRFYDFLLWGPLGSIWAPLGIVWLSLGKLREALGSQDGARMAPDGAKMAQDEAKVAQDGAKMAQDGAQTSPEERRKQNKKKSIHPDSRSSSFAGSILH